MACLQFLISRVCVWNNLVLSYKLDASQPADELIMSNQTKASSWSWKTPASLSQFKLIRIGLTSLLFIELYGFFVKARKVQGFL